MGYPSEPQSSAVLDSVAKDCFINSLDDNLALRVREKEPNTLDDALHVALRLEAIHSTVSPPTTSNESVRGRNKFARGTVTGAAAAGSDEQSAVMAKLCDIQSRMDSDFKRMHERIARIEANNSRTNNPTRTSTTTSTATKKGCFRCRC